MKMSLIYSSVKKDFLYWNVLIFIMELTDEVNTLRKSNSNHVSVALPYSSTACG